MDVQSAIYHYCNYQERSHFEVRNKLYELGCRREEVEQYLTELIEQDLLNEERFACAIASGRFRLKNWGKIKIIQHLKKHRVSEYCIKKALATISPEDYLATLSKLSLRKWKELKKERNQQLRKLKLTRYLLQKGFENDLIYDTIQEIIETKEQESS